MTGGKISGALFFLFMYFASLYTVIAVFENIISYSMDRKGWSRGKAVIGTIPIGIIEINILIT